MPRVRLAERAECAVLTLLWLAGGWASAAAWPLQPGKAAEAKVLQFRGAAVAQAPAPLLPPAAPLPLDAAAKAKLAGGVLYAKVSPEQPIVPGKCHLRFQCPNVVAPANNASNFLDPRLARLDSLLCIELQSGAGHRYFFDCSVASPWIVASHSYEPVTLTVRALDGTTQTADFLGTGHLTFVLEAQTAGWYIFEIRGNRGWYFFGCEVTQTK